MNIKFKSKKKKLVTAALALTLLASPIMAFAEPEMQVRPISAEEDQIVPIISPGLIPIMEEEEVPNYIEFNGKISRLDSKEDLLSILVENDLEEGMDKLVAHISDDVLLLDEGSLDFISKEDLEEGMEVSIYYGKDTIMLMSYPPQLGPDVIVVRSDDVDLNIKIDKFDENLTSDDNSLKLNINEDVELIDFQGNEIKEEDLVNKDLVVFYTVSTRSIPAQTTPEKVIAIKNHQVKVLDYFNLNEAKFELKDEMYRNADGVLMLPLREIAEALEFEVEWVDETKSVELAKGDHTAGLRIGEDRFKYYDMVTRLEAAPEFTESKTYIPLSFVERILVANVEITMDGVLEIDKY